MELEEFLKPEKEKIKYFALLIGLTVVVMAILFWLLQNLYSITYGTPFVFVALLLIPFFYLSVIFSIMLAVSLPFFFAPLVVVLSYFSASFIFARKKLLRGIVLYFVLLFALSFAIAAGISGYNEIVGHACSTDAECFFTCGLGAHNGFFILLKDPFILTDCFGFNPVVCKSNRCAILDTEKDTERFAQYCEEHGNDQCYFTLATETLESEYCEKIGAEKLAETCRSVISKRTGLLDYYAEPG